MNMELIIALHDRALAKKQEETELHIARLQQDLRQDEANLLKARRNVYGHFRTALQAYKRQGEGAVEKYRELMQKIFQSWSEAKDLAALHQDAQRLAVEETKLGAWREAMALLDDQTGEGNV